MRRRPLLFLVLLLGLAALVPARNASALPGNCHSNPHLDYTLSYGDAVCAGQGGGCTFCADTGTRGSGSWDVCYFSVRTGDMTCYSMN